MSVPLLQTLREYIIRVVRSLYLSQPELGIVRITSQEKYILLLENQIPIPFSMCFFSSNLRKYSLSIVLDPQNSFDIEIPKGREIKVTIYNELQDQDMVMIVRIFGGLRYVVLEKVVTSDRL